MPTSGIGFDCSMAIVRPAVDLNRKPRRRAIEIEDVFSSRMLPAIFETARSFSQFAP
jgi:hypothetical protein